MPGKGYPAEQWTEEADFLTQHIYPGDREKFIAILDTVKKEKEDFQFDHRFMHQDGKEVWLHTELRFAYHKDQKSYEVRGLSVDITQIKGAEEILRLNKMRSDFLAEASMLLSESLNSDITLNRLAQLVVPKIGEAFILQIEDENAEIKSQVILHSESSQGEKLKKRLIDFHSSFCASQGETAEVLSVSDIQSFPPFQKMNFTSGMSTSLFSQGKKSGQIVVFKSGPQTPFNEYDLSMWVNLSFFTS